MEACSLRHVWQDQGLTQPLQHGCQASGTAGVTSFQGGGDAKVQPSKGPCKVLGTLVKSRRLRITVAPGGTRALLCYPREQKSGAGRGA